ncbi:Do family serine endopeptidase [Sphingomonas sp. SUN039]|uniref:Do family serine endopeptidase n=1 Tax=Sphingomonas sp. SUN039 TaxID=2937787 RepID=UPI0021641C1D|nr:Do family serine endopeptidase [Sphingomonas sp. SUN039]UVO54690.1 Do family serine endopeptidase [Sphingomonas sp. SUN039]
MRNVYALTTALLIGGTAATMVFQTPSAAQVAQNEPGAITVAPPRAGAPMSFADMVAKLQPAVVNISTTQKITVQQNNPFAGTPFGDLFGQQQGGGDDRPVTRQGQSLGSGFIISADGYIVTNNHVISAGTRTAVVESITVTLTDKKEYKARVVGRDTASDIAVLKIDAAGLPFVRFGDSARARVGDWVVAIGNPFGIGSSVTAGIVSALHRVTGQGGAYDRFIQTDASINQGNSGGPMFDMNGNVIGINSQIYTPTGGNVGIGFAIPAEQAKPIVDQLRGGAKIKRGYLGIQLQPMTPEFYESLGLPKDRGELVASTVPGEGAARAGIQQGDVITKVNNQDVTPDQTLSFIVANLPIGSRIPIELIRNGQRQTVTATLGERPSDEKLAALSGADGDGAVPQDDKTTQKATRDTLGFSVTPMTADIARALGLPAPVKGVVITSIDQGSDAGQKGLQRGDIVTGVNQRPVTSAAEIAAAVAAAKSAGRPSVLLSVQRGNTPSRYVPVRLNDGQ